MVGPDTLVRMIVFWIRVYILVLGTLDLGGKPSPHFSQSGYCGGGSIHPDCVLLPRPSRRTVKYDCEGLSRKPCQEGPSTASPRNLVRSAD